MRFIADKLVGVRGGGRSNTLFWTFAAALVAAVLLWASPAGAQEPSADLSITKDGPGRVEPGERFRYTITVSNAGGAETAAPVIVEDELPAGVTLVEADPAICTPPGTDTDGRLNVTCTVPTLAAGESRTITLTVRAPTEPGEITNRASARAANEPDSPVNSNQVTTRVEPNLVINKLDDPDPVSREGLLEYTLRVQNRSEVLVSGVSVTDELPVDDVDFVRVDSADFDCTETAGVVQCVRGVLRPGEIAAVRILVEPERAGTIDNTGAVFARGIRGPIDTDTEDTVVRQDSDPGPNPDPDPDPGPGPGNDLPEGDECSPVVDLDTDEEIGVISGDTADSLTFTNTFNETLPLRIVYATSSGDGSLNITVTPEDGGEAILDETIEGKETGVLEVDTDSGATYDIEILPEDQGYAVLFEIGSGPEECTDPESLDPEVASPSDDPRDDPQDDPQDDVVSGSIPDGELPDTGGVPISVLAGCVALLLVGTSMIGTAARR